MSAGTEMMQEETKAMLEEFSDKIDESNKQKARTKMDKQKKNDKKYNTDSQSKIKNYNKIQEEKEREVVRNEQIQFQSGVPLIQIHDI